MVKWHKYFSASPQEWISLFLLFVLAFLYCLVLAPKMAGKGGWKSHFNDTHEGCVLGCASCQFLTAGRGNSYYINVGSDEKERTRLRQCLVTFWSATHFLLYLCAGFIAPGLALPLFGFGCVFEVYEKYKYDCADPLDVIYNGLGLTMGVWLRKRWNRRFRPEYIKIQSPF